MDALNNFPLTGVHGQWTNSNVNGQTIRTLFDTFHEKLTLRTGIKEQLAKSQIKFNRLTAKYHCYSGAVLNTHLDLARQSLHAIELKYKADRMPTITLVEKVDKASLMSCLRECDDELTSFLQWLNSQPKRDNEVQELVIAARKSIRKAKDDLTAFSHRARKARKPVHDHKLQARVAAKQRMQSALAHQAAPGEPRVVQSTAGLLGAFQMSTKEGEVLSKVVDAGTGFLGKAVKGLLGLSNSADAPSVINIDEGNMVNADLPREVTTLSFHTRHSAPDATKIIQLGSQKSMSLQQRFQVPQLLAQFPVNTSCTADSVLVGYVSASPNAAYKLTAEGATVQQPAKINTLLSYFGESFAFWRGELEFDIQVIATEFHRGQIFVCYSPNNTDIDIKNIEEHSGLYSVTFDITEQNQITFRVPYVNEFDYKVSDITHGGELVPDDPNPALQAYNTVDISASLGRVYIFIQNPFVAPSTVNPNIYINVWIKAGKNFQFSVPEEPVTAVRIAGVFQSGEPDNTDTVADGGEEDKQIENAGDEYTTATQDELATQQNIDEVDPVNPIEEATEVDTASTENTMGRSYLVGVNIKWQESHAIGDIVHEVVLPGALLDKKVFAARGLVDYHEFFRGGFTATVQLSSQKQYMGLLCMAFVPAHFDRTMKAVLPTITQWPHAFVDLGRSATASLDVPYNTITRLLRFTDTTRRLGRIVFVVINPMRPPPEACTQVSMSVKLRINSPYIGVKRLPQVAVAFQMKRSTTDSQGGPTKETKTPLNTNKGVDAPTKKPTSSVAARKTQVQENFPRRNKPVTSYIDRHDIVYDLLKRPNWTTGVSLTAAQRTIINPLQEPNKLRILTTYAYWNGSLRTTLMSVVPLTAAAGWQVSPIWDSVWRVRFSGTATTTNAVNQGCVFWRPQLQHAKVIELPYYCRTPLLYTPQAEVPGAPYLSSYGAIMLQNRGTDTTPVSAAFAFGDDAELYFPMPAPPTIIGMPVGVTKEQWLHDLTQDGDVEANPGPTFIGTWVKRQIVKLVDEIAAEKMDQVKTKVRELQSFLRKNIALDAVSDIVIPVLTTLLNIALQIRLMIVDPSPITVGACFTAIALNVYSAIQGGKEILEEARAVFEKALGVIFKDDSEDLRRKARSGSPVDGGIPGAYHAGVSQGTLAGVVATLALAGIVGSLGYNINKGTQQSCKDTAAKKLLEAGKAVGVAGGAIRGTKEIWNAVTTGLTTATEYFIDPNPHTTWWKDNKDEWVVFRNKFNHLRQAGDFAATRYHIPVDGESPAQFMARYDSLITQAVAHFPYLDSKTLPTAFRQEIPDILRVSADMVGHERVSVPRREPVGVWIHGSAGCGKSVFGKEVLPPIIHSAMKLPGKWTDCLYNVPRDSEQKYWDGYQNQYIAYYDDMAQNTDDKDYAEIINIISAANCPVPMARLDDKLTTFTSPLVVCSSNIKSVSGCKTIKDHKAIVRRFPVAVTVSLKPNGAVKPDGTLDYQALQQKLQGAVDAQAVLNVYDEVYRIQNINLEGGQALGDVTFRTFIMRIVEELKARAEAHALGDAISKKDFAAVFQSDDGSMPDLESTEEALLRIAAPENQSMHMPEPVWVDVNRAQIRAGAVSPPPPRRPLTEILRDYKIPVNAAPKSVAHYQANGKLKVDWMQECEHPDCEWCERLRREYLLRPVGVKGYNGRVDGIAGNQGFNKCANILDTEGVAFYNKMERMRRANETNWEAYNLDLYPGDRLEGGPDGFDVKGNETLREWKGLSNLLIAIGVTAGISIVCYFILTIIKNYVVEKVSAAFQHKYNESMQPKKGDKVEKPKIAGAFHQNDVYEKVQKHTVHVRNDKGHSQHAIVLDQRHILLNYHFVMVSNTIDIDYKRSDGEVHSVRTAVSKRASLVTFAGTKDMDLCVVALLGSSLDGFKSFLPQLRTHAQWMDSKQQFDVSFGEHKGVCVRQLNVLYQDKSIDAELLKDFKCMVFPVYTRDQTHFGDCGRPYWSEDGAAKPFLGIHSGQTLKAGPDGKYISGFTPVAREDVEAAIQQLAQMTYVPLHVEPYNLQALTKVADGGNSFDNGSLNKIGKVTMNGEEVYAIHLPTTNLRRTTLQHADWDDSFLPSRKSVVEIDGVRKHPLYTNAQKYKYHKASIGEFTQTRVLQEFKAHIPKSAGKVLSEGETLNGFGEMSPMVTNTSAGFITKYIKKEDLFDKKQGDIKEDGTQGKQILSWSEKAKTFIVKPYGKSFCDYLAECDDLIRKGEKPIVFWTSTCKDEMLKAEKIRIAKTRVFECPDFVLTCLFRKYFGHFLEFYKRNRGFKLGHAIGIDREVAAKAIYEGLKNKEQVFDIDYSNFDGSVHTIWFDIFLAITDHYYEEGIEAKKARHTLISCLRNSLHIIGDTVYESFQGNKSGNPMTDVFNSVCNTAFLYAVAVNEYEIPVGEVYKKMPFLCYGDDVIASTDKDYPDLNRETFYTYGQVWGFLITPANKGEAITPFTHIEEVSFLKSKFKPGPVFHFPLPKEIIHRELRWEWKKNQGDNVVFQQRIQTALRMAVHHGPEWYALLEKQLEEQGVKDHMEGCSYDRFEGELREKQLDWQSSLALDRPAVKAAGEKTPVITMALQSCCPQGQIACECGWCQTGTPCARVGQRLSECSGNVQAGDPLTGAHAPAREQYMETDTTGCQSRKRKYVPGRFEGPPKQIVKVDEEFYERLRRYSEALKVQGKTIPS